MARLEYLDDFYGLRNEKRIHMRHTLSTLALRTILALQAKFRVYESCANLENSDAARHRADFMAISWQEFRI